MKANHSLFLIKACVLSFAIFILTCNPLLASPLPTPPHAQNDDEATLRNLTKEFYTAYENRNLNQLMSLWHDNSPDYASSKQTFEKSFSASEKIELKNLQITRVKIDGGKAILRVVIEIKAVGLKVSKVAADFRKIYRTFEWAKKEGQWKIMRYVSSVDELVNAVVAAKTEEERKTLLSENNDLMTTNLVDGLITQGFRINNNSQAMLTLQLALELAKKMEYKIGVARALHDIGNVHSSRGMYKEALKELLESLNLSVELGEKKLAMRTMSAVAFIDHQQGNYMRSFEQYQQALKLAEELGDKREISAILNNIGLTYQSQADFTRALEYFQKSMKMAEEIGYIEVIAAALNNMGDTYLRQGNYLQSLKFLQKCLKLAEDLHHKRGISYVLNNIGNFHYAQANYQQALEYYQKSLKIAEELGDKSSISGELQNIGKVHSSQTQYQQALEYLQKSLKIYEGIGEKGSIVEVLIGIGDVHYMQGNYQQALDDYQQSLKIAEELNYKERVIDALTNIAGVYHAQGKYQMALDVVTRASANAAQIKSNPRLWNILTLEGMVYRSLNKPDLARQAFANAIVLIEQLRNQVAGSEQDQQRFFEIKVSPYYNMIILLVSENNPAEAISYSDRAKGRVLLDVLRNGKVNITKAMSLEEQETERSLNEKIVSLNAQLYYEQQQQPDKARISELDTQLQKTRLDYESFQTNLYAAHPELKLQRGQTKPLTLDQIGDILPDAKTAIVDFVVADNKVYLFLISKNAEQVKKGERSIKVTSHVIDISDKDLNERIKTFRDRVAEGNLKFREQSRELYDLLLKPVEEQLKGKTTICIVPDGALWELPFQALQSKDGRYFIEDHALFFAPSLSVLYEMVEKRNRLKTEQPVNTGAGTKANKKGATGDVSLPAKSSASPELLAFGNPALNTETVEIVKSVYRDEKIGPLPEAEREVKTLAQIYGQSRSLVFIGTEATETNFKKTAYNSRILHFATHGILDDRNPMYSRLMLARVPVDTNEDGMLEAREILNMDLKADLAVLSACQTARGRIGSGEGVIGMSWALFVAGVPSTIVSQWKVESSSTTELMIEFHRNLISQKKQRAGGMTKAEALRQAALKLLRSDKYKHPADWAGFVLVGDGF